MLYGAYGLMVALFDDENPEPEGALPNYKECFELGELNELNEAPVFSETKAYGNNRLARHVYEFKEAGVDITILDMLREHAAKISGSTLDAEGTTPRALHFGAEDNAPYCGIGFYSCEMLADNKKAYIGVVYPKGKSNMQGQAYTTKGENITLAGRKLKFLCSACKNPTKDWKLESPYFDTEEEAWNWVKTLLKPKGAAAAAGEGTA